LITVGKGVVAPIEEKNKGEREKRGVVDQGGRAIQRGKSRVGGWGKTTREDAWVSGKGWPLKIRLERGGGWGGGGVVVPKNLVEGEVYFGARSTIRRTQSLQAKIPSKEITEEIS